jgi:hypothetical protein
VFQQLERLREFLRLGKTRTLALIATLLQSALYRVGMKGAAAASLEGCRTSEAFLPDQIVSSSQSGFVNDLPETFGSVIRWF